MASRSSGDSSVQRVKESKKFQRLQRTLGQRVRSLRDERGLTLYEVQAKSGVDWKHWQKIEAGQLNLTLATLHRIAEGLGVTIADLFEARPSKRG